jgi:DNA-binding NarL/FixJ family response regulator
VAPADRRGPRVLLFDDQPWLSAGLAAELVRAGVEVSGVATTVDEMHALVRGTAFDVAVLDVLVGPDEDLVGLGIGMWLKTHLPRVGVLMFTSHDSPFPALRLLTTHAAGVGYLLKTRVQRTSELVDAIRAVGRGQNVVDAHIGEQLVPLRRGGYRGEQLTERDVETLKLVVEGKTNRQIAQELTVSPKTVHARVSAIFRKLGITEVEEPETPNRRVTLILEWITRTEGFQRARAVAPVDWPAPGPGAPQRGGRGDAARSPRDAGGDRRPR